MKSQLYIVGAIIAVLTVSSVTGLLYIFSEDSLDATESKYLPEKSASSNIPLYKGESAPAEIPLYENNAKIIEIHPNE